jgi:hypothetical protein
VYWLWLDRSLTTRCVELVEASKYATFHDIPLAMMIVI